MFKIIIKPEMEEVAKYLGKKYLNTVKREVWLELNPNSNRHILRKVCKDKANKLLKEPISISTAKNMIKSGKWTEIK